jgi:GMP synthase (glutamine-hydrolysing)
LLLVVDNGSIYTKQLTDFLTKKNILFRKSTPHILELNSLEEYGSIILSGRTKNDKKINKINSKIINFSIKNDKKLLGICYGAEILALTLGGTIRKTKFIQKGNETIEILQNNLLTNNSIDVFESHGFEISKLPNTIKN